MIDAMRPSRALAPVAWAALFAVAHFYWALGGRLGVPAGAAPIAERPWFLAYDLIAGALCVAGAIVVVVLARGLAPRRSAGLVTALGVGVALLVLRASVGLIGDVVLIARGDVQAAMLFDLWFLLGAVVFARFLAAARDTAPSDVGGER